MAKISDPCSALCDRPGFAPPPFKPDSRGAGSDTAGEKRRDTHGPVASRIGYGFAFNDFFGQICDHARLKHSKADETQDDILTRVDIDRLRHARSDQGGAPARENFPARAVGGHRPDVVQPLRRGGGNG